LLAGSRADPDFRQLRFCHHAGHELRNSHTTTLDDPDGLGRDVLGQVHRSDEFGQRSDEFGLKFVFSMGLRGFSGGRGFVPHST
jgi:hypothetical protein